MNCGEMRFHYLNPYQGVRCFFRSAGTEKGPLGMRNDEILTVKETAALLKTTRQQVRKMIVNEELPAVKVGREWRVLKAGIVEFFEKQICY